MLQSTLVHIAIDGSMMCFNCQRFHRDTSKTHDHGKGISEVLHVVSEKKYTISWMDRKAVPET